MPAANEKDKRLVAFARVFSWRVVCFSRMETFLAILRLVAVGVLPPLAAVGFYFLELKTPFGKFRPIYKQIIAGVVFGGICIIATEFGANINGAVLNVRDAAAVTAGLLYGIPGGIIAGLIGGAERFASAYWNNTFYTQWACTISTFISGLTAGLLRHFVFTSRRPSWALGLLVGLLTETFHIMMIFLTNVTDTATAFSYVRLLGNKMITANLVSSSLAMGVLQIIDYVRSGRPKVQIRQQHRMRTLIALNLSSIGILTILISGVLTYGLQSSMAVSNADKLLSLNVKDVSADIDDTSDATILNYARNVANKLEEYGTAPWSEQLEDILPASGVSEIHYVNADGIITATTVEASYNFDMSSGTQSAAFLTLLDNPGEYVQAYMPTAQDETVMKKYAAVSLSFGGFVQVGQDTEHFYDGLLQIVTQTVKNRHIGGTGFMLVADITGNIYSSDENLNGKQLSELGFPANLYDLPPQSHQKSTIQGTNCFYMFDVSEGFFIIAIITEDETLLSRDMATFVGVYLEILIFGFLFICVYALIDRLVLRDLGRANRQLAKIAEGDLEQRLNEHRTVEFIKLSDSINRTVDSLKGYIALEASRYDEELAFGKQIQFNSLPSKGAYLFRHDFSVYGSMVTAKQVGGDFYDYFMVADKRIAFLIADVSGKGIPAAMFMMKTKSIIKALCENGLPIADIMERANDRVCEGNETGTFVTAWLGICDLKTGLVEYVNAGHNPPMICNNGQYRRMEMKRDLVLGAISGMAYRRQTCQLQPGDMIYLYTDGITEAEAGPEEFYGEQRLLDCLNKHASLKDTSAICKEVEDDVHRFVAGHDQSDDMTMVAFLYQGVPVEKHLEFPNTVEGVETLCEAVSETLENADIPMGLSGKVRLVVEEVAANIAFHAYEGTEGIGELDVAINANQVVLTFGDYGPHFNPIEKQDPDITLSAADRPIGGLGIFMVKKIASKYFYTYQDRKNVFLIIIDR